MSDRVYQTPSIQGAKGKGGSRTPVEAPNTLRSNSTARIIDLIGEGEVGGLIDGLKSVYIDETPVQNPDGSFNFEGIKITERVGTPNQTYVPGFPSAQNEVTVNAEVKNGSPITRQINNLEADAVDIKVRIPALYKTIKSGDRQGDIDPYQVSVAAELRSDGGAWQRISTRNINGKNNAPYEESIRVILNGQGPWQVRLVRLSADHDSQSNIQDRTYFSTYTETTFAKLAYPDLAYMAIEVDAQQFGNEIPERAYEISGQAIQVPDNYDPDTREYTGIWTGSFKMAVSDNPAWILYDLLTNSRYGAGLPNINTPKLYEIGKYCDELVPRGDGTFEPRFTINTQIQSREDAYKVLNAVASAARIKLHWGSNTLVPTQDRPTPVTREFSNTNVIDGTFKYQGSSKKARHNVANVTWNDPDNNYLRVTERVEDPIGIREMDEINEADITAFGCTSRSQARRYGLWKLYTERKETDVVEFDTTLEVYDMEPNEVINLYDQYRSGARLSGRIVYPDVNDIELDEVPDLSLGTNWQLIVKFDDGSVETRSVLGNEGNVIQLQSDLTKKPSYNSVWTLQGDNVKPVQYRVIKVTENEDFTYTVTAQMHDPDKYDELENDIQIEDDPTSLIPVGPILSPSNVTLTSYVFLAGGTQHQGLNVSWSTPDDPRVIRYQIQHKGPQDFTFTDLATTLETSYDLRDVFEGEHSIRVRSVSRLGTSPWTTATSDVQSLLLPLAPTSVQVSRGNFNITLRPVSANQLQEYQFWRSTAPLTNETIESNATYAGNTKVLNDSNLEPGTTYYYYIRGVNAYGTSGWYSIQTSTKFEPNQIINVISGEIRASNLNQTLQDRINKIDGPASVSGTVNARLAAQKALSEQADTNLQQQITDLDVRSDNNSLAVSANANALSGLDVRVTSNEDNIVSISQDITALQGLIYDSQGNPVVTANAFSSLSTRVQQNEDDLFSISQDVTQLNSNITSVEDDLTANVDALDQLSTSVTQIGTQVNANAQDLSILQTEVNGQTAAIQQKADITSVTDLETDLTDILAQYTVKVDVNGNVAGFGLMNDGVTSDFFVLADRFAVVDPSSQNGIIPFAVENDTVYLAKGVLAEASVGELEVEDGSITNAKIGEFIESDNFVSNQSGWNINKQGNAEFNNVKVRGKVEGSEITGSTIKGSAIIGSAFLAPTELDDGSSTLVGLATNLTWSDIASRNAYWGPEWYHFMEPIDIYSADYSDLDEYRRYRRHLINATCTISISGLEWLKIWCYYLHPDGSRTLIGAPPSTDRAGTWGGTYWNATYTRVSGEVCTNGCNGVTCSIQDTGARMTFNLTDYPFDGDGQIQFRVYTNRAYNARANASSTAVNDY